MSTKRPTNAPQQARSPEPYVLTLAETKQMIRADLAKTLAADLKVLTKMAKTLSRLLPTRRPRR